MDKINFQNGITPLNDTNLNQLQTNIENAINEATNNKISKNSTYTGDLNNLNDTCFYYCNGATNSPAGNGYLFTQKYIDNYIYQRFVSYNGDTSYERVKNNGVWGNWILTGIKTIELNIENYLKNSWSTNGGCHIIKNKNMVHLQLSIRNGTDALIMQLPEGMRPKSTILIPAIAPGVVIGYLQIDNYGQVTCYSELVGKSVIASCSFIVG